MNKTCATCAVPQPCQRPELLGGRGCEEHMGESIGPIWIGDIAVTIKAPLHVSFGGTDSAGSSKTEAARTADLIDMEGPE